ncbi:MAG: SurA N-terminal domain-containing protein, partial [Gammaproteobacteria bacterium]|nr:SurA N-terminal domain-containing protein [Gammaproteobacteria bacterium]
MLLRKIALISTLIILVSGCEQMDQLKDKLTGAKSELAEEKSAPVDAVATVNGQSITVEVFNTYARARMQQQQGLDVDKHRGAIINELVNRELLLQEAIKNGLDKKPQVSAEIQSQKANILSTVMMRHQLSQDEVTEEMIKQEYDDFIKTTNFDEYKVSYIMVATKEDADAVIASLD